MFLSLTINLSNLQKIIVFKDVEPGDDDDEDKKKEKKKDGEKKERKKEAENNKIQ